jgi:hypothetical protein
MSGSEYLLWSYGQFEKMTFFPPDPLTMRLCRLSSRRPGAVLSFQLVVASPLVVLSLRRLLVFSSSCRASWLMHHLSPSSHCAALLSSCHASWLSHCLSPSSCCATLLSTCRVSLLLHRLSLSSCCAPRHPLILSSRWLVVTSPLDALPSRRLIVSSCRLSLSRRASWLSRHHFLVVLWLYRPFVLSSCWLVVALPVLALPSCPLVVVHRRRHQMPRNAAAAIDHHRHRHRRH